MDVDRDQLERGRRAARERHLAPRVEFLEADASRCDRTADRVLCLGASHAWGGTEEALRGLRQTLSPGGRCLFGEGFWSRPPSREARELFGALSPSLSDLVKVATTWGWRAVYSDVASLEEWDAFETEYRHGLEEFARAHPEDPLAVAAGARAEARRTEYEVVYRGTLGFAYLVLERVP